MNELKKFSEQHSALLTFDEKLQKEYGIKIADFMAKEWFDNKLISDGCRFMGRNKWVENKRLFARGEQDTQRYKNIIARQSGDMSYLNLDWRIINLCGKFSNVVTNGLSDDYYKFNVRALDRYAALDKKKRVLEHKKNMKALPMLQKAKELLGVDLIPSFVPEDEDELDYVANIKDRPRIEIAEEILINKIKNHNNWKNIKDKCDKDLVECGLMAAQVYTDPINGVSLRYVDVADAIHSYTEHNDFSDAFYFGFVDSITLSDIQRESGFNDTELREIARSYRSDDISRDYNTCPMEQIIDIKVNVLRFAWKTTKKMVYKTYSKEGKVYKVAKRPDNFGELNENQRNKSISKIYDTWLEGNFVVGARKLYGYKECENIVRDEMNKAMPPFIFRASNIYKNRLHSFITDIEKSCDEMQYTALKIQHLKAELKPDATVIDIDALADISVDADGNVKKDNWKEHLALLNVKNVILKKHIDMGEAGIKQAASSQTNATPQGSALTVLLNIWAKEYNDLREITGINPARDGSLPADALLGVNKMAELASNTITKHIVDASVDFDKRVCETISARVKSISSYPEGKEIMEKYKIAVGKESIEAMEVLENRNLHDFGFITEMVPGIQEIKEFQEDLAIAMKEGSIDVEDKIEAQQIAKTSIKQANEYLKYIRKKRLKQKAKEQEQMSKLQTESNIQTAKATSEGRIREKLADAEIKVDIEAKLSMIRVKEKMAMQQIEAPIMDKEFQQEVYLTELENMATFDKSKYMEDRKDQRVNKQSTQQSQMVKQRQDNTEPIDFENEFSLEDEI